MSVEEVKGVLVETLRVYDRADSIDASTRLMGSLPELDSLAMLELVTALQDRFGITFDEEDLTADRFETLGTLSEFVDAKRGAPR